MIKGLRKKFILVGMLSVIIAELLMIGTIDAMNYKSTLDNIRGQMEILVENDGDLSSLLERDGDQGMGPFGQDKPEEGSLPPKEGSLPPEDNPTKKNFGHGGGRGINEETPFMLRFFTVTVDETGQVTGCDTTHIAMVDDAGASEYGRAVWPIGRQSGFYDEYYYSRTDSGLIIFLDCRPDITSFESFRNISIVVGLVGAVLVLLILIPISGRVLAPVEESYKKQKRFITDASHEIKTPLAIISADAEVLELDNEENEWIESIKNQVKRLSELTEKLVFLSRMDEGASSFDMTELDLSEIMYEVTKSYKPLAETSGKKYITDIEYDVLITGDKANLTQMITLLIDNAFKYSDDKGTIKVSLKRRGKKKEITVYNTVDEIAQGDLGVLFERFYRDDASRSTKTGGHGIGLSVVAAIAEAHRGTATARSEDGRSVTFTICI